MKNEDRCIAKVRNAGIEAAMGSIIITIDCDNRMTKGTIKEAYMLLKSGRYIGDGAPMRFERYSFPLLLNDIMYRTGFKLTGLYCGISGLKNQPLMLFENIGTFVRAALGDTEGLDRLFDKLFYGGSLKTGTRANFRQ